MSAVTATRGAAFRWSLTVLIKLLSLVLSYSVGKEIEVPGYPNLYQPE